MRWSSRRRPARSPAAAGHPRCTSPDQRSLPRIQGGLFAAISSTARSTADSSTADPSRRPAAITRRRSASRIRCDVYRLHRPRCRPTIRPCAQRLRFVDAVTWCASATTGHRAPHRPAGPQPTACSVDRLSVRIWRCASARTCHICRWSGCSPSQPGCDRPSLRPSGRRRPWRSRRPGSAVAPSTRRRHVRPALLQLRSAIARCSARDRGSCLASRVSKVACCARCNASTGVGGRP